jgi:hypothetical protein
MMPTTVESENLIPIVISREAWDAAHCIDAGLEDIFRSVGLQRVNGQRNVLQVTARIVQLAINRAMERVDA